MGIFRAIPPVLAPIRAGDLLRAFTGRTSRRAAEAEAARVLRGLAGEGEYLFFGSGRAAMVAALRVMAAGSDRREVVIPAYTCFTVPSAVVAAGLRPVPCDLLPESFGFDPAALEGCLSEKTLCILPTHLYGIPCDVEYVVERAGECGAVVLEDAAQALGGAWGNRSLGGFGDLGLFSLGRGKNVTTGHGGILRVGDPALAEKIRDQAARPGSDPWLAGLNALARGLALGMLARPPFYGVLAKVPALEIGVSRFDPDIPVENMGSFESRLLVSVLERARDVQEVRNANASKYLESLSGVSHVRLPEVPAGAVPAWLRFPVLVPAKTRRRILNSFAGEFGISPSYPAAVPDIPGIEEYGTVSRPCPASRRIAEEILTLPVHPGVRDRHIEAVVDCLKSFQ